ncbi:hypothetical protein NDU88_000765 [Pleurodeles waltl]|uniref:Uncharacterized protein n=1 Tax=Pleurodeles waltl TaxID=8319 RepID=A0AAV7MLH2_PLEWA|nr:hypothetical protein NDU88_000765 [Pleurodeles waltl]
MTKGEAATWLNFEISERLCRRCCGPLLEALTAGALPSRRPAPPAPVSNFLQLSKTWDGRRSGRFFSLLTTRSPDRCLPPCKDHLLYSFGRPTGFGCEVCKSLKTKIQDGGLQVPLLVYILAAGVDLSGLAHQHLPGGNLRLYCPSHHLLRTGTIH